MVQDDQAAFKRFQAFAKALISVPKKEIEDKAKAYERKKEPRKSKG